MILGKPHPYHDRQGSRAQCRSPRIPANGNTPSPSHSSNEFPQNDPSGFMNGSSDTMDDVSISPNDALSEANDLSSRPSRKIKPVSRCPFVRLSAFVQLLEIQHNALPQLIHAVFLCAILPLIRIYMDTL